MSETKQVEAQHTAEPWSSHSALAPTDGAFEYAITANIEGTGRVVIAEAFGRVSEDCRTPAVKNARRIVACVNACAGIPTDKLEQAGQGSIDGLVNAALEAEYELSAVDEASWSVWENLRNALKTLGAKKT